MTLEQVQALRDRWYAANNMTLIVVGGLDRLLPAYLERTFGELPATEPEERRNLESITQAEQRRDLTRGWLGDSVKLHWLFIEPVLDNDHQATLDLLSRYLDWALYDQLRLRNGLSYGPSAQRESFGDTGLLSLNADLERDDIDKAVKVMQALFDHLRKEGLDPDTFARIKDASVAKESWSTQGNSALADYYWGALNDYTDGRFANPVRKLRQVSLAQANEALKALLKEDGYLRIEKPLLGYDELYGLVALMVGLILAAGLLRWRRQGPQRPSGATRSGESAVSFCQYRPLRGRAREGVPPTSSFLYAPMPQIPHIVQRIIELLKRYPGIIALGGFLSGIGSFILVDRQAGLASWVAILMLVSWVWLMLENTLTGLFARTFNREIPQPLLRYATQMIHQETLFFVLPFFFITTTWNSGQLVFTGLLGAAGLISITDPLYYKWLAPGAGCSWRCTP
jgi:hypothetical protein